MKRKLSKDQEFDILKMVLDKFLWLGMLVMGFGLYQVYDRTTASGLTWIVMGAIILVIFIVIISREYEMAVK